MSIKRIVAANMQQGLKLISQQLGPDAVILSNKRIPEGVEILASVEDEPSASHITPDIGMTPAAKIAPVTKAAAPTPIEITPEHTASKENMSDLLASIRDTREKASVEREVQEQSDNQAAVLQKQARQESRQEILAMQDEIKALKDLLSSKDASGKTKKRDSVEKLEIQERLHRMGFNGAYSQKLSREVDDSDVNTMWKAVLKDISDDVFFCDKHPLRHGGIWAFTGPTGGGKTTTIGKIAAQYVIQNDATEVVVISMDTFRIGAQEQLKVLCDILTIDFQSVSPERSLPQILTDYADKKLVLIDTGGCQRGLALFQDQLAACAQFSVQHIFVAPTTSQSWLLEQWIQALPVSAVDAVMITKVDESHSIGGMLSLCHQFQLPLLGWCNGQTIPDDIAFGQINKMLSSAVLLAKQTNVMKQKDFFAA